MDRPWAVEFWESSLGGASLLAEVRGLLTAKQRVLFAKRIRRLEEAGPRIGNYYFDRVRGSRFGLGEFRLTLDKVELRLLFSLEPDRTYLMLVAYKEKSGEIPRSRIDAAERRLVEWRSSRNAD